MRINGEISKSLVGVSIIIFLLSLIPILYCARYDYATGDDLGKSYAVHRVIKNGGSAFEVIKTAVDSARDVYYSHEGTWASNFILALQPGIWGERYYSVTPIIGIISISVGILFFLYEILVKYYAYDIKIYLSVSALLLTLVIQLMPYIKGGLFWYTGMAHYDLPFCMALIFLTFCIRYYRYGKFMHLLIILFTSIYLGGSHYQAILLSWLLLVLFLIMHFVNDKNIKIKLKKKESLFIFAAFLIQLVGFYYCYKSPGNTERAEADFSFSFYKILKTVKQSVVQSTTDGFKYIVETRWVAIYIVFLILLGVCVSDKERIKSKKNTFLICLYSYLVYCAMYAPALYYLTYNASEGISGGYYDINFFVFMIFLTYSMLILGNIVGVGIVKKINSKKLLYYSFNTYLAVLAVFVLIFSKHLIAMTADYTCITFIKSGQLYDFEAQMQERLTILEDDSIKNVVLPEMNDQQGPFMHMALVSDESNFTNTVTRLYYDKDSVIAVPRAEYYEKYAE